MTYHDLLVTLGESTERDVLAVFDSWTEGDLDQDEAVALIAAAVAAGNSRAAVLADVALAAALMVALRAPVPTFGLMPRTGDPERLRKASQTLLDVPDVTRERVARLGRVEPLETAARAYSEGMSRSAHVQGWTRQLHGDACQLCQWWHRGGRVWPADHPLQQHKGCTCTAMPVLVDYVKPVAR